MGTHQHFHEKSPPRRCGARRLISTTKSRRCRRFILNRPGCERTRRWKSRVKSAVQLKPRVAGDNGFSLGARR